ncbi:MAG: hypothetical protein IAE93_12950 [Ignavibacteria bacterium]|nr:hypothetical protein [Ignavibacteria bacterium]
MALSITRDKGAIHSHGGGIIKVKQVQEDGTDLSPAASVVDIGYIQDSEFNDQTPLTDVKDETGATVTQEEGDREISVKATLMQSDSEVIALAKEVRGKFYALYKYNGIVDGKHQEIFFGVGKITPQINLKFSGGRIPFEYKSSKLASAVTIDTTDLTAWGAYATAEVTIAANDFYQIVETSVA